VKSNLLRAANIRWNTHNVQAAISVAKKSSDTAWAYSRAEEGYVISPPGDGSWDDVARHWADAAAACAAAAEAAERLAAMYA